MAEIITKKRIETIRKVKVKMSCYCNSYTCNCGCKLNPGYITGTNSASIDTGVCGNTYNKNTITKVS